MPVEQVLQAMVILRDEDGDAGRSLERASRHSISKSRAMERSAPKTGQDQNQFSASNSTRVRNRLDASSPCSSLKRMFRVRKMKSAIEAPRLCGRGRKREGCGVVHRNFRFSQFLLNAYVFSAALRICVYSTRLLDSLRYTPHHCNVVGNLPR